MNVESVASAKQNSINILITSFRDYFLHGYWFDWKDSIIQLWTQDAKLHEKSKVYDKDVMDSDR